MLTDTIKPRDAALTISPDTVPGGRAVDGDPAARR
jgi:hypothetical protein